jgi:hypothetical protein
MASFAVVVLNVFVPRLITDPLEAAEDLAEASRGDPAMPLKNRAIQLSNAALAK